MKNKQQKNSEKIIEWTSSVQILDFLCLLRINPPSKLQFNWYNISAFENLNNVNITINA